MRVIYEQSPPPRKMKRESRGYSGVGEADPQGGVRQGGRWERDNEINLYTGNEIKPYTESVTLHRKMPAGSFKKWHLQRS